MRFHGVTEILPLGDVYEDTLKIMDVQFVRCARARRTRLLAIYTSRFCFFVFGIFRVFGF